MRSRRFRGKNTRLLGSLPLFHYVLQTLARVKEIQEIYVFTSDKKIAKVLPDGISFMQREKHLDQDSRKGLDICRAFCRAVEADLYVLAHATSPFLSAASIRKGLKSVLSGKYDSALTVNPLKTFAWFRGRPLNYDLKDVPRTQDLIPVYVETSSYYIFHRDHVLKHGRRIGFRPYFHEIDAVEGVDIDTAADFRLAQALLPVYRKRQRASGC